MREPLICRILVQTLSWVEIRGMNQLPSNASSLFCGCHFDRTITILCIRCYIAYKLSYRDLVEMMAERSIGMAHTTILR